MEASVGYWRFDYIIYVYNLQEIAQTMGGWQCRLWWKWKVKVFEDLLLVTTLQGHRFVCQDPVRTREVQGGLPGWLECEATSIFLQATAKGCREERSAATWPLAVLTLCYLNGFTYMHASMHTCIKYILTYMHAYTYTYTYAYTCTCTCTYTYTYTFTYTYTCIHAYIYIYMHTCIHACIHT